MAAANLYDIIGYVSAIVNAADWVTVTDAVTNGTTTITSATASFTQADAGKYFSVANAGAAGKPLIGRIATVTNSTTVLSDTAATATLTVASLTYGGVSQDPRHPLWKIGKAVLNCDLEVCHQILKTPNHPRRNFFTFTTTTTAQNNTGVPLVSRSGEPLMLEIQHSDDTWRVGKRLPDNQINKLLTALNNESSVFSTGSEGYYILQDGQIYFTGDNVRVTTADVTLGEACQAPAEYSGVIGLLAASQIFLTEGDDLGASQMMAQLGASTLVQLINREAAIQ